MKHSMMSHALLFQECSLCFCFHKHSNLSQPVQMIDWRTPLLTMGICPTSPYTWLYIRLQVEKA